MEFYKRCLVRFPYLTRMTTSATILGTADFVSQTFIENKPSYDLKRIGVNFTVGFCAGPWLFIWFNKMQPKIIQSVLKQPIEKPIYNWQTKELCVKKLLLKMSTDYFICFPVMQLLYHLIFNTLYNNSIQAILQAFDTKVSFSLSNHYQAWPIASCVIHLFVPLYLKAIFTNLSGTTWNNYVNYLFNNGKLDEEKQQPATQ